MIPVGIDVSKAKLHVMLVWPDTGKRKAKTIANRSSGWSALLEWLTRMANGGLNEIHVGLESIQHLSRAGFD